MKTRILTVEPESSLTAGPAAKIRLKGRWLAALGFAPGCKVYATPTSAGLLLRPETPVERLERTYEAALA